MCASSNISFHYKPELVSQSFSFSAFLKRQKIKIHIFVKTNNGVQLVRCVNLTQLFKTIKSTVKWTGSVQERLYICCSSHMAKSIIGTRFVVLEVLSTDYTVQKF